MNAHNKSEIQGSKFEVRGGLLARNTFLNFLGQTVPLIVGVVTMPFIVRGLGTERFGLLSLAWVVLGYFTIFDLGLGRATTKFVAEAFGKGEEHQIPRIVWTAVTIQAGLGLSGALVLAIITPLLVECILTIPSWLVGEAKATFYLLCLSIPTVLVSSSFSGVLEAKQKFDLVNSVRIPSSISTYLLTLIGMLLHFHLPSIVALVLVARLGTLFVLVAFSIRVFHKMREFSVSFALFPRLFAYGSWVMVSNIINPFLVYFDRFLIGSLLSMAAVAYYMAACQAVTPLWIISGSLCMALFPAFSALEGARDLQRLEVLFAHSVKYMLLVLGPVVLVLMLFAEDVLQVWLGSEFATQSKIAMQILALGVLANSLAYVPYALLQARGRPDITAKLHLLELPFYFVIAWFLVSHRGIAGAAAAWTLRVTLDALLLFFAAFKVYQISPRLLSTNGLTLASLTLLASITYGLKRLGSTLPLYVQAVFFVALFSFFAWVVWRKVLDTSDRGVILKLVNPWLRQEREHSETE